uniref:Uncharacterized protein n=1 Tax=Neogobius melanostomus TaxID=47308 RepID=A0A8C6T3T8_9GOBI
MDLYTTVILGGLVLFLLWLFTMKNGKLPPGPLALPIVGNILLINKHAMVTYGLFFIFHFNNTRIYVIFRFAQTLHPHHTQRLWHGPQNHGDVDTGGEPAPDSTHWYTQRYCMHAVFPSRG